MDFLLLPIAGALFSSAATAVLWILLGLALWGPFKRELEGLGFSIDTVGYSFMISIGPIVMGIVFAVGTFISLLMFRSFLRTWIATVLTFVLLSLPAALLIAMQISNLSNGWAYPLSETTLVLIAAAWTYFLVRRETGSWSVQ